MRLKSKLSSMNGWQRLITTLGIFWLIISFFLSANIANDSYSFSYLTFLGVFVLTTSPIWLIILCIWIFKGFKKFSHNHTVDSNHTILPKVKTDPSEALLTKILREIKKITVRGWRGEEKLWKVYWLITLPFTAITNYIDKILLNVFPTNIFETILWFLLFAFEITGFLWMLRANWMCSYNVDNKNYGHFVRFQCIIGILIFVIAIKNEIDSSTGKETESFLHQEVGQTPYTPTLADIEEFDKK